MNKTSSLIVLAGLAFAMTGCKDPQPDSSGKLLAARTPTSEPPPKLTFSDYPVPEKPEVTSEFLARGKAVYDLNCAACHGVNGDAKAEAAAFLLPKPRNFKEANYRLRSTSTGNLPTDVDLYRAVSLGMPGTPMPPWHHILSEDDRWAVVEYIKKFSPKFEEAERSQLTVVDLGSPPERSAAAVTEGKALYTKMACFACHGDSGRGDGLSAASLTDDSGQRIKARDLTKSSGFKSGYSTKEIARTVLTGFNGTPMVGFDGAMTKEDAWKLAYYVESLLKPGPAAPLPRVSQNYLEREQLGEPDVRIQLTERAWQFDPAEIRVKKGQIVEITFEPTDNGLGVGHGFAISSYDEVAFINGAMVGVPKTVKFRADRSGKFTYYCSTQCSTDKLHPLMNGTFYVEDTGIKTTAALD